MTAASLLLALISPLWAGPDGQEDLCSSPDVLFCENFEARPLGALGPRQGTSNSYLAPPTFKNKGWESPNGPPIVVNTERVDGTKSVEIQYSANRAGPVSYGYFDSNAEDVWIRFYTKWSTNYKYSAQSTKFVYLGQPNGYGLHILQRAWNADVMTMPHGITPPNWTAGCGPGCPDAYHLFQNQTAANFQGGRWYCIQAHIKQNTGPSTASVSDGVIEIWVDGVASMRYTTVNMDRESTGANRAFSKFMLNGGWACNSGSVDANGFCSSSDPANIHPEMQRWHDNIVVSKTKVDCLGSTMPPPPPPPTTPPPPPPSGAAPGQVTDLSGAPAGSNTIHLTFTEVGDGAGGAAKYDVRMMPGASMSWGAATPVTQGTCASPLAGASVGASRTCTVTGLAAGTQYQFQLLAFRGTLNVDAVFGGFSNVASATPPAPPSAQATDINRDGTTDIADVQLAVNQTLDPGACSRGDVNGDGSCSVIDVQRVVNAALGL